MMDEMQQIQGELLIQKAMLSEHKETIDTAFENGDILSELIALKENNEAQEKFYLKINYLEGKIDAYLTILKQLGLLDK